MKGVFGNEGAFRFFSPVGLHHGAIGFLTNFVKFDRRKRDRYRDEKFALRTLSARQQRIDRELTASGADRKKL